MKVQQIVENDSCRKFRSVLLGEVDKIIEGALLDAPFVAE